MHHYLLSGFKAPRNKVVIGGFNWHFLLDGCWDNCLFSQVPLLSHFSKNKYHLQHETDVFKEKKRCLKAGSTI